VSALVRNGVVVVTTTVLGTANDEYSDNGWFGPFSEYAAAFRGPQNQSTFERAELVMMMPFDT
jgi:hypothetical protein